jgi:hypothetical protein
MNADVNSFPDREFSKLVKARLAMERFEGGLLQYELAQKLRMNPTLLCHYLQCRRPWPSKVKAGVARILGLDVTIARLSAPAQIEVAP